MSHRRIAATTAQLLIPLVLTWPSSRAASQSVNRQRVAITAGPNVQVSKARSEAAHYENLATGDPAHAGRMISCIHVYPRVAPLNFEQQCYTTFDAGKNWEPTLRVAEGTGNGDPTEAYGRGDTVYVVALILGDTTKLDSTALNKTQIFRSTDGGRAWEVTSKFAFIDREFVAVDRTNGKYGGRVYVVGNGSVSGVDGQRLSSLQLFRSTDGGRTFQGPEGAAYMDGVSPMGIGTGVVLSDGTLVAMFGVSKRGRTQNVDAHEQSLGPNGEMRAVTSTDGGETFTKSVVVASYFADRRRSEGGMLGQLVVDPGSVAFKDRVYLVWPALIEDRIQINLSYSADKGKTWSKPVVVNDDRNPADAGKGPDHLLPAVGVNKDGVVLVTWADRRESSDNFGWRLRAAASLDGGETFSASVPIASASNAYPASTAWDVGVSATSPATGGITLSANIDPFYVSGGHTTGMAVDASGAFFPTWVDNRTGVAQLWTAPVTVSGAVVKNGSPELAAVEDVSKQTKIEVASRTFDQRTGVLSIRARLRNASKDTIVTPAMLRVRTLESQLGVPEVVGADNGEKGTGAIWDLSSLLRNGTLPPGARSQERTFEFRLNGLRGLRPGREFQSRVMTSDMTIYGKIRKARAVMADSSDRRP
jgi:hypothetical protein